MRKTARNTDKVVPYRVSEDILEEIDTGKKEGYKVIALELTDESIPLDKVELSTEEKIALVIGNEQHGVSKAILEQVLQSIHIPMFGKNSSINVTQATGIALFNLTKLLK